MNDDPSDPCRFAAFLPHCCDRARAANDKVGTLASLPTPLPGCPMADQCQCMVMNVEDEPDEPPSNVIPITRGRGPLGIGLALIAFGLLSCATIGTPSRFHVPLDSTPSDAVVMRDGVEVGRTPCVVVLPRCEKPMLTLRKEGFHDQMVQVENHFPPLPLLVIDILIFPFIIVDMVSGAKWQVDTAPLSVHMVPEVSPPPAIWRRSDYDAEAARVTSRPR